MINTYLGIVKQLGTSLIPIQPNSKAYDMAALRQRGYRTLNDAKQRGIKVPDVLAWWNDKAEWRTKKRNVALVTNEHLLIVDFDTEESYRRFCDEYPTFSHTMTVKSPHGHHLYYNVTEAIPDNIISTWPKVELFHNGGCILCPPSQIDGSQYEYVDNGLMNRFAMLTITSAEVLPMVAIREERNSEASSFRVPLSQDSISKARLYRGVVNDIKARLSCLDLASRYTDMMDKGTYHIGCCPAHDDSHPSFRVAGNRAVCAVQSCNLHDARALDVIELYCRLNGLPYRDGIAALARELGLVE